MQALARGVLRAGYIAIADGAFLKRWQRDLFHGLANELGIPFVILDLAADAAMLRERIARRIETGRDASEATLAVLNHQVATEEALAPDEQPFAIECAAGKEALLPEIRRQRPDLDW
ncbi:MAG: hypothetical protein A3H95_09835 [Acidobacteria bacterium RIFCSPLOWO2_02_FULL_64_15]|nr:MAG: hypothetical protein A3H95_09835 [Acidobacteria bacterium RIFCSPLOWO2_02_FULL_64_15]